MQVVKGGIALSARFLGSFGQPAPGPRAHILDLMASTLRWEVSLALSDMQGTEFTEQ